jgi:hypothetical protein
LLHHMHLTSQPEHDRLLQVSVCHALLRVYPAVEVVAALSDPTMQIRSNKKLFLHCCFILLNSMSITIKSTAPFIILESNDQHDQIECSIYYF